MTFWFILTLFTGSKGSDQPSREEERTNQKGVEENELHRGVCKESGQLDKVTVPLSLFLHCAFFSLVADSFNALPLLLCRSSSVSSEGAPAEKERSDLEGQKPCEEEPQRSGAAPVEELAAATSPAAKEVPAHLQRQQVGGKLHFQRNVWLVWQTVFVNIGSNSVFLFLAFFRSQWNLTLTLKTLRTVTCARNTPRTSSTTSNRERWAKPMHLLNAKGGVNCVNTGTSSEFRVHLWVFISSFFCCAVCRRSLSSVTTCPSSPASTRRWGRSWSTGWLKCRWDFVLIKDFKGADTKK